MFATLQPQGASPMSKILRNRDVCEHLGISPATLWRWVRAEHFPAPVKLGPNTVGWPSATVEEWLTNRAKGDAR
ncbi:MAG: AlpA family phage regulatory protein [Hydrogenophilaceae bacterium]|nr:AlpA family phage regulatory protein [Hydrogenophilaceae bacterium]